MAKPHPKPIDASELASLAIATMASAKFPLLATVDGDQPRLRPVSPVRTERFTIYIANLRAYGKTHEIAANPKVELCYVAENHDQVRITGTAGIVTDRALLESIWSTNHLLRSYLGSIDNPDLIIYQVTPDRVRFMREWALEYYEVPMD
jgi:general stress protein 26